MALIYTGLSIAPEAAGAPGNVAFFNRGRLPQPPPLKKATLPGAPATTGAMPSPVALGATTAVPKLFEPAEEVVVVVSAEPLDVSLEADDEARARWTASLLSFGRSKHRETHSSSEFPCQLSRPSLVRSSILVTPHIPANDQPETCTLC